MGPGNKLEPQLPRCKKNSHETDGRRTHALFGIIAWLCYRQCSMKKLMSLAHRGHSGKEREGKNKERKRRKTKKEIPAPKHSGGQDRLSYARSVQVYGTQQHAECYI